MIWVYAVTERPEMPPPRRRGLAQAPLEGVRAGELLAIVTRHAHTPAEPAPDALWTHERVVERVMAERAVLPMRFGTAVADEEALRAALEVRAEQLTAALARVRGRVELSVRAMSSDGSAAAPAAPASGRDYMLSRLREDRRASELHEPLAALAADARRRTATAPGELLRAAYLVERPDVGRFRNAVSTMQARRPGLAVLCTGPWPPYSFVS